MLRWRAIGPFYWLLKDGRQGVLLASVRPAVPICPYCNAPTDAEYADVGFGGGHRHGVQVSPQMCPNCHSYEEQERGWVEGEWVGQVKSVEPMLEVHFHMNTPLVDSPGYLSSTDARLLRRQAWCFVLRLLVSESVEVLRA